MKKLIVAFGVLLLAAGIFSVKYFTMLLDSKSDAIVVNKPYTFKENYQDKKLLAGAVEHIFIGEVVTETGNKKHNGTLNTQFKVMITQNIKGALLGDVTVNQEGGYYKENGKLYVLTIENTPILKEKQVYLFAVTKTNQGYFQMMPKYGATHLKNEEEKYKQINAFKVVLGGH